MKHKRVSAFLIDMLFITLLVSLLSSSKIANPRLLMYNETLEVYTSMVRNMSVGSAPDTINMINMMYKLEYSMFFTNLYYVVLSFLYFVVFQYFTGATLGKKLMKLEIKKIDKSKMDMFTLIKRYLLGGLTYFSGVHFLIIIKLLLLVTIKESSVLLTSFFTVAGFGIDIANIIMLFKDKDGRTLADKFAKTKVQYLVEKVKEI